MVIDYKNGAQGGNPCGVSIVDEDSCTGLEWITGLDGAIEIGSFSLN